jgi:hypothetical protein
MIHLLWTKMHSTAALDKTFELHRMLSYNTKSGDKSFSAPFLHHFYTPTIEGMCWLQKRFEAKIGLKIDFVHSGHEFLELQTAFIDSSKESIALFILMDKSGSLLHVTPCVFFKNTKGMFLLHLDSIGGEAPHLNQEVLKSLLDPRISAFFNKEPRQKDAFSCRTESFILLKQIALFLKECKEATLADIGLSLEPCNKDSPHFFGKLQGHFLKTAQALITDERQTSTLFHKKTTLAKLQESFSIKYIRFTDDVASTKMEEAVSSVYLQCKVLKYILAYQKELEDKEKKREDEKLVFDAEF